MIDQAGRDPAPSPAGTAYEEFFGLNEAPFADSPDPRFLFPSQAHRDALEQIEHSILRGERLTAVIAEAGTGKSTLCRVLASRAGARRFVATVGHAPATADDLLRHVLDGFDQLSKNPRDVVRTNRYALQRAIARFLEGLVPLHARALIILDDAHHLSPEVLEQVRVLSDLQADEHRLLQIVLLGQPGLLVTLKQPGLRQVEQVIFRRRQLQGLAAAEVKDYIEHRLSVARGGEDDVWNLGVPAKETPLEPMFTIAAIETIAQVSRGVPRLVNAICDRALTVAWVARSRMIDRAVVLEAVDDLHFGTRARFRALSNASVRHAAAAALVVVALTGTYIAQRLRWLEPISAASSGRQPGSTGTSGTASASNVDADHFYVVVSAFGTTSDAQEFRDAMLKQGVPVITTPTQLAGNQVVLGPFPNRQEASAIQRNGPAAVAARSQVVTRRGAFTGKPAGQ